jgi:SHS2 domain-containing protein
MDSNNPDFSLLDHTADLGITVRGADLKNLFEAAAISMMQVMVRRRRDDRASPAKLSVASVDLADLMVRWLGEILYLFEGEKQVLTNVVIDSIFPTRLDATLETVAFDPKRHEILCEIKAVTYHQIEVIEKDELWEARIIFDL